MKTLLKSWRETGRPLVMGVLNTTPDSFSDGGSWHDADRALEHARAMVESGADIIDVGGESTRPGAEAVPAGLELERVIPVIEAIHAGLPVCISIDTSKAEVMRAAVDAGASLINDVCALQLDQSLETAAQLQVAVCLMHMQGDPRSMQQQPEYDDVADTVESFLLQRAGACTAAGMDSQQVLLDPGFGFGKALEHNLTLVRSLDQLSACGFPVLAGLSRKSMLAAITGRPVDERLAGSLALAALAAQSGAAVLRVHDVAPTVDVLRVLDAVWPWQPPKG